MLSYTDLLFIGQNDIWPIEGCYQTKQAICRQIIAPLSHVFIEHMQILRYSRYCSLCYYSLKSIGCKITRQYRDKKSAKLK